MALIRVLILLKLEFDLLRLDFNTLNEYLLQAQIQISDARFLNGGNNFIHVTGVHCTPLFAGISSVSGRL